ncbi:nucleotide-binding alpha-beta plait domain-containing protein [Tanacetum coccineum]
MGDIGWTEVRRKNRIPMKNMGKFRSKEDDVARLSTSVFVSNLPDSVMAKDLFHACKQYGHVVDSFIPFKRDKNGNRFGFVRFLNVFNSERLVNNLCTVWIDRYKIKANIAQFQRNPSFVAKSAFKKGDDTIRSKVYPNPKVDSKTNENSKRDKSYVGVVNNEKYSICNDSSSDAALVIGDECLSAKAFSLALFGRVKEFASMANLNVAIGNEGFVEISIKYIGELWVMMEFQTVETLNKFRLNVSIASWVSQIINASNEFETDGRIAWVELEGVPLKLWSGNTFRRIATKWGKLLDVDDHEDNCYHSKRICIQMKAGRFIKEEFKIIHRGKSYWIRANETVGWVPDFTDESDDDEVDDTYSSVDGSDNQILGDDKVLNSENAVGNEAEVEVVQETVLDDAVLGNNQDDDANLVHPTDKSEDSFGLYKLLNKPKMFDRSDSNSGNSLKFPPGFTPPVDKEVANFEAVGDKPKCCAFETKSYKENVYDDVSCNKADLNNKDEEKVSSSSGHFKRSGCPRTDGSILGVLEEVVKVGQVMGYNMDGCISNMGEIISSKGVDEVYR